MQLVTGRFGIAILLNLCIALRASSQEEQPFLFAPELFTPSVSAAVCGFSPDGKTIYFIKEDSSRKKQFMYKAKKKNGRWTNSRLLPFSGQYNDVGGRISADGKRIYFTSDRPGGSARPGDTWNIWMVKRNRGGWGKPQPLMTINDKGMECCAVAWQNDKLLFSSHRGKENAWWIASYDLTLHTEVFSDSLNAAKTWQWPSWFIAPDILLLNSMGRKDSRGMDDIYLAFFRNEKWSEPVNIGEPVNSNVYEDGAILSPDKKWLIFLRHDSPDSPSKVMAIAWKPIYERLRNRLK